MAGNQGITNKANPRPSLEALERQRSTQDLQPATTGSAPGQVTVGEPAPHPVAMDPAGYRMLALPKATLEEIFGAPATYAERGRHMLGLRSGLADLPVESRLRIAGQVHHGVLETAEKLNLAPRAVVASIPEQAVRLEKIAELLGSSEPESLQERIEMFGTRLPGDAVVYEADASLGFTGARLRQANQLLNAPLHLLQQMTPALPAPSAVDATASRGLGPGLLGIVLATDAIDVPQAPVSAADLRAAEALDDIAEFLDQTGQPAARQAFLAGLKKQLGTAAELPAMRELYQSHVYRDVRDSPARLQKVVGELAAVRPGQSFDEHIRAVLLASPDWNTPLFSPHFGLDGEAQLRAQALIEAPLAYLSGLDNASAPAVQEAGRPVLGRRSVESQKLLLGQIKTAIKGMVRFEQAEAREVMLVGLSHRLKELNSDELRLDAARFLNDHFDQVKNDGWYENNYTPMMSDDHRTVVIDNLLGLLKNLGGDEAAGLRRKLLVTLNDTMERGRERAAPKGVNDKRESLLKDLSSSFIGMKKSKREAIKLLGKSLNDVSESRIVFDPNDPDSEVAVTARAKISQATQLGILGNMLAVAGDIHSVETQRQILVAISHAMNNQFGLDTEGKKELVIMLGKSIPNFHFDRLDSGRNMQHKAYKLFRSILREEHYQKISLASSSHSPNAITNRNRSTFSPQQLTEIISAAADTLPEQSDLLRPGRRVYMNNDLFNRKRWPDIARDAKRNKLFYPAGRVAGAVVGAPIDLALALKPYITPRPPIRTSLAKNILETLESYPNLSGLADHYDFLETLQTRQSGWASLVGKSPALGAGQQHKVVESFLQTVDRRDREIGEAHTLAHQAIAAINDQNTVPLQQLAQLANEEISNLRKAVHAPKADTPMALGALSADVPAPQPERSFYNVAALDEDPRDLPATAADLARRPGNPAQVFDLHGWVDLRERAGEPTLLSARGVYRFLPPLLTAARVEQLVTQVKTNYAGAMQGEHDQLDDLALDAIIADYVTLDDYRNDPDARINGMSITEFREATRPAVARIGQLHRDMRASLAEFNGVIDQQIEGLEQSKAGKSKFNLKGRNEDRRRIGELKKSRQQNQLRMEEKTAAAIAAIELPHLQRYKTAFAGSFHALADILPGLRDGVAEGVVPVLQKKKLSERAADYLATHNALLEPQRQAAAAADMEAEAATASGQESQQRASGDAA